MPDYKHRGETRRRSVIVRVHPGLYEPVVAHLTDRGVDARQVVKDRGVAAGTAQVMADGVWHVVEGFDELDRLLGLPIPRRQHKRRVQHEWDADEHDGNNSGDNNLAS